jgi:hypothetical protein
VIVVTWEVPEVGAGRATAEEIEAVPGAVERIVADALKRHVGGVAASVLPRMLSPLVRALLSDIRSGLAADGRWEYAAEGLRVTVVEE